MVTWTRDSHDRTCWRTGREGARRPKERRGGQKDAESAAKAMAPECQNGPRNRLSEKPNPPCVMSGRVGGSSWVFSLGRAPGGKRDAAPDTPTLAEAGAGAGRGSEGARQARGLAHHETCACQAAWLTAGMNLHCSC